MTTATRPTIAELIQDAPPLRCEVAASLACVQGGDRRALSHHVARDARTSAVAAHAPATPFFACPDTRAEDPIASLPPREAECVVLIGAFGDCFDDGPGSGLDRSGLRCHAAAVASLAHALAQRLGADPAAAFTAGLLHDVGRAVLDRQCQRGFAAVLRYRNRHDTWIRDAEQAVLGYDHAAVADALAAQWGLPGWLREAVGWHHMPEAPTVQHTVTGLVHVADVLARGLAAGNPGDDTVPFLSPTVLERQGLTWADLRMVLGPVQDNGACAQALLEAGESR